MAISRRKRLLVLVTVSFAGFQWHKYRGRPWSSSSNTTQLNSYHQTHHPSTQAISSANKIGHHQVSILNYSHIHQLLEWFITNHSILHHLLPLLSNLQLPPYSRPPLHAQINPKRVQTRHTASPGSQERDTRELLHRLGQYYKPTRAKSNENKEARTRVERRSGRDQRRGDCKEEIM
jgi:hypothetical protein